MKQNNKNFKNNKFKVPLMNMVVKKGVPYVTFGHADRPPDKDKLEQEWVQWWKDEIKHNENFVYWMSHLIKVDNHTK